MFPYFSVWRKPIPVTLVPLLLFRIFTMNRGRLVVKMPPKGDKLKRSVAAHRALQSVSAECGLDDLIVRSAVRTFNSGKVTGKAIIMERAQGTGKFPGL